MQTIFEPIFDVSYLIVIFILGFLILKNRKKTQDGHYFLLFGTMALILGFGDAFHLIPRILSLIAQDSSAYVFFLGLGKLVTSLTVTVFYVLFYIAWKHHFQIKKRVGLDVSIFGLAFIKIILSCFPQNHWFLDQPDLNWELYRNLPFMIMGVIIIYLLLDEGIQREDKSYVKLATAVFLSFMFYMPVILFASQFPLLGLLMIPKTLCYVWVVWILFKDLKRAQIT